MLNYTEAISHSIKQGTLNIREILAKEIWCDLPERHRLIYLWRLENQKPRKENVINKHVIDIFVKHCGVHYDWNTNQFIIPKK